MLSDIRSFKAELESEQGRALPDNVAAVRWLDRRFEPIIARIPGDMFEKLEAAEIYHQLLEHRWFLSEQAGKDVSFEDALDSYIADVLRNAPEEKVWLDEPTQEIPIVQAETDS